MSVINVTSKLLPQIDNVISDPGILSLYVLQQLRAESNLQENKIRIVNLWSLLTLEGWKTEVILFLRAGSNEWKNDMGRADVKS